MLSVIFLLSSLPCIYPSIHASTGLNCSIRSQLGSSILPKLHHLWVNSNHTGVPDKLLPCIIGPLLGAEHLLNSLISTSSDGRFALLKYRLSSSCLSGSLSL